MGLSSPSPQELVCHEGWLSLRSHPRVSLLSSTEVFDSLLESSGQKQKSLHQDAFSLGSCPWIQTVCLENVFVVDLKSILKTPVMDRGTDHGCERKKKVKASQSCPTP